MKPLFASLLILLSTAALAAPPEDAYFTARDAAIARMTKLVEVDHAEGEAFRQPYDKEARELTRMLQAIVGPVSVKGFPGPASLNLGSLVSGDQGFATLDGLSFSSPDGRGALVASTEPLFRRWVSEHEADWEDENLDTSKPTPDAVLRTAGFYFRALEFNSDAAFYEIAELPITAPPTATVATARLGARSQDQTPMAPTSLDVALVVDNRLLIAEVPLKSAIPAVPACSKIVKAAEPKISAADDAYVASGRKDAALGMKLRKLRHDTDTAFRACFSDKSKTQKGYLAAIEQARTLAGAMAAK